MWANVSELPRIEAYVSASHETIEENKPVTFTATFNHPETLRDMTYSWDFRDGSKIVKGKVEPEETRVEIEHPFDHFRPDYYPVEFEIWGDSDAGEVRETHIAYVLVDPAPTVNSTEFEPGETATHGLNVLVVFFTYAGTAAVWLAVTSPIWLIAGATIFFAVRLLLRRRRTRSMPQSVPDVPDNATQVE